MGLKLPILLPPPTQTPSSLPRATTLTRSYLHVYKQGVRGGAPLEIQLKACCSLLLLGEAGRHWSQRVSVFGGIIS